MDPAPLAAMAIAVGGALYVAVGVAQRHRPAVDVARYLDETDGVEVHTDEFQRKLAEPLRARAGRAVSRWTANRVTSLMPGSHVERVRRRLLLAGKATTRRPEEFLMTQAALGVGLATLAVAYVALSHPSPRTAVGALVMLPLMGVMLPSARLNREGRERQESILKDLPDTLDLLAISVEAGMGFEGAISVVCQHFDSPLAEEFSLALQEMALGLPRRDAFQNLKRRTDVPELSNFVLAILQADALGVPIGRVLKTQSTEMRSKRRMWAREKAGKLPVKILFPLVLFIFPPIFAVVLGPAGASIGKGLK